MKTLALLALAALAAAVSPACGRAGAGAELPPFPAPRSEVEALCDGTLGVSARALTHCCSSDERASNDYDLNYASRYQTTMYCSAALTGSVSSRRAGVNSAAAAQCASLFAAWSQQGNLCGFDVVRAPYFLAPPCRAAIVGLQARGQPCRTNHECQDGLACGGWGQTNDGVCVSPSPVGGRCGSFPTALDISDLSLLLAARSKVVSVNWGFGHHPECVPGARCNGLGICTEPREPGCGLDLGDATCRLPVGGPCKLETDCEVGLGCETSSPQRTLPVGRCVLKRPAGAPCSGEPLSRECRGRCAGRQCVSVCGSG